ncbi:MAG: LLM class flavin-dependent oxidoreductase [Thaumarchaeota archaeon]|nr:LLM class flavin-dependent oxidoreductase [Nitrososphaerota archaeon]
MRIGVSVRADWPDDIALSYAKKAEESGFYRIWTNGTANSRDQLIFLTHVASITKSVKLGTAIIDPYSRHPVALASSIATVSSLTKRELTIAIGSSHPELFEKIGINYTSPVETCKEAIVMIRKLIRGETLSFLGERFQVSATEIRNSPRSKVLILVGAQGPKFVRMAGEYADGLVFPIGPESYNKTVIETFSEGVRASARDLKEVKVVAVANISVSDDTNVAIENAKIQVAETISHLSASSFAALGISREEAESYRKNPKSMSSNLVRQLAICGDVDSCIKQLGYLNKLGIEELYLHNASLFHQFSSEAHNFVLDNMEQISKHLIPNLNREVS